MGFDLWTALGITPGTGLGIAGAGALVAALLALRVYVQGRKPASERGRLRLDDPPR